MTCLDLALSEPDTTAKVVGIIILRTHAVCRVILTWRARPAFRCGRVWVVFPTLLAELPADPLCDIPGGHPVYNSGSAVSECPMTPRLFALYCVLLVFTAFSLADTPASPAHHAMTKETRIA